MIQNAAGDALISRGVRNLEVVRRDLTLPALSQTSQGTGTYQGEPVLRVETSGGLDLISKSSWNSGANNTAMTVEFRPSGLRQGKLLTYYFDVTSTAALLVDRAQIDAKYKNDRFQMEFFGGRPHLPCRQLVVEVEFPEGKVSNCHPVVFLPKSEIQATWIDGKTKPSFSVQGRVARFVVEYPLIDFSYAIAWSGV